MKRTQQCTLNGGKPRPILGVCTASILVAAPIWRTRVPELRMSGISMSRYACGGDSVAPASKKPSFLLPSMAAAVVTSLALCGGALAMEAVHLSAVDCDPASITSTDQVKTPSTLKPPAQDQIGPPSLSHAPPLSITVTAGRVGAELAEGEEPYSLPIGTLWRYSEFLDAVEHGEVMDVTFSQDGEQLRLTTWWPVRRAVVVLPTDPYLAELLEQNKVEVMVSQGLGVSDSRLELLANFLIPLLFFTMLFYLLIKIQQIVSKGGPFAFAKSRAKEQEVVEAGVTFNDVAGCDGAKLELQEMVDFLRRPEKYSELGAKIPKGALLVGPPGTGKTLLAKAVAGEAGVPFFSCAASEFVEMFVGVGSSRVRDLFQKAKSKAPCIIFIDEIDAVGRARGSGFRGGNEERESTVNQLLAEMDGFEGNTGVIVLAATNRPDVLDTALTRAGRFDRTVTVDRPDVDGRVAILKVHSQSKKLSADLDLEKVARRTPGFTGADLANLMNEAAIIAAQRELVEIGAEEVADALERIQAGPEKKGTVVSERKRRLVAYHEAGHALVGALMPDHDPVAKISIVPRGSTGGLTFFAPSEERLESGLYSKSYLENKMAVALGGRIAEELIFGEGDVTTGAAADFQQVTRIARMMVLQLGFSKDLGHCAWGSQGGSSFLGGVDQSGDYSAATADMIDKAVMELVERAYRRAKDLLLTNMGVLHKTAAVLLVKERMDGEELMELLMESQVETYLREDALEHNIPYNNNIVPVAQSLVKQPVDNPSP